MTINSVSFDYIIEIHLPLNYIYGNCRKIYYWKFSCNDYFSIQFVRRLRTITTILEK